MTTYRTSRSQAKNMAICAARLKATLSPQTYLRDAAELERETKQSLQKERLFSHHMRERRLKMYHAGELEMTPEELSTLQARIQAYELTNP